MQTQEVPTDPKVGDDSPDHLICCDENVTMCGLDASGMNWVPERLEGKVCKYCEYIEDNGIPCPHPLCDPE